MFTDRFVGELQQIRVDIQKWLTGRNESAEADDALTRRNAEELIWKLQERYGYIPDKQEIDQ